LLIEKDISYLVNVKYYIAPTVILYCVLSSGPRGYPSTKDSDSLEDKGVGEDVHFVIPTFARMSAAYFLE
jgi:hypothetical protein